MKTGDVRSNPSRRFRRLFLPFRLFWILSLPAVALAEEPPDGLVMDLQSGFGHQSESSLLAPLEPGRSYALGVHRFQLDGRNQMLGWKLSDRWYFGRQRGDDSGLALVWQDQRTRFSLTRDGVRLTRSF